MVVGSSMVYAENPPLLLTWIPLRECPAWEIPSQDVMKPCKALIASSIRFLCPYWLMNMVSLLIVRHNFRAYARHMATLFRTLTWIPSISWTYLDSLCLTLQHISSNWIVYSHLWSSFLPWYSQLRCHLQKTPPDLAGAHKYYLQSRQPHNPKPTGCKNTPSWSGGRTFWFSHDGPRNHATLPE